MSRPKFNHEYILQQMKAISHVIPTPISIYLLGDSAMALYGLKEATKDMDVILSSLDELNILISALRQLNCVPIRIPDLSKEYRMMEAQVILENNDRFRWDIFYISVCNALALSEDITSRTKRMFEEENLSTYVFSKEDIFLFKGITERGLDLEDMATLAESGIEWNTVITECLQQSKISGRIWEAALYERICDLRRKYGIKSPIERQLREVAVKKMTEKRLTEIINKGANTVREISTEIGFSESLIRKELNELVKEGKLLKDITTRPHRFHLKQ